MSKIEFEKKTVTIEKSYINASTAEAIIKRFKANEQYQIDMYDLIVSLIDESHKSNIQK
jgi:hypothetical protein